MGASNMTIFDDEMTAALREYKIAESMEVDNAD
jgi:hypothetical protein